MSIELFLSPSLQRLIGDISTVNVDGDAVGECLEDLVRQYPQLKDPLFNSDGALRPEFVVYINGASVGARELGKRVKEGDQLHLMSFFFGG